MKSWFLASTITQKNLNYSVTQIFTRSFRDSASNSLLKKYGFPTYTLSNESREIIRNGVRALTPLEKEVLQHIQIAGMSIGSISPLSHAHIVSATNTIAMELSGVDTLRELKIKLRASNKPMLMSNSGEGGDIFGHQIKQIASGRFGVNLEYVNDAHILQFKGGQGVKPGLGGALAKFKVSPLIAELRGTEPWTELHSPAPHHDQYSIEDLAQIIRDYLNANPNARFSTKLVSEPGVATIALGVAKAMGVTEYGFKNNIEITGQGATGNAPLFTKYHAAYPWLIGLSLTHQKLVAEGIRDQITLSASGGLMGDGFHALLLGADIFVVGLQALIFLGCIKVDECHNNTCPTGIATVNPKLIREKNTGNAESIARGLFAVAKLTAREIAPYFDSIEQAIGKASDILTTNTEGPIALHAKYLLKPKPRYIALGQLPRQKGASYNERQVIEGIRQGKTEFQLFAENSDLSFGARIGHYTLQDNEIKKTLAEKNITITVTGLAPGQSFGVLSPKGLTLIADHTNDGTGKSLSGGEIFATTCGSQAGFAMTDEHSVIATRAVGSRGAVRKSGGVFITETAGAFFANFHTKGSTYILGTPIHYPQLSIDNYTRPFALQETTVGHGFASGFSGGHIIMPKALWQEILEQKHLSPNAPAIQLTPLDESDKKALLKNLKKSSTHVASRLQKSLYAYINENPDAINELFIKLLPPQGTTPDYWKEIEAETLFEQEQSLGLAIPNPMSNSIKENSIELNAKKIENSVIDPAREKSACGTGLMMSRDGSASHQLLVDITTALKRSAHRGAQGVDQKSSDGCGVMLYFDPAFFQKQFPNLALQPQQFAVIAVFFPITAKELVAAQQLLTDILAEEQLCIADQRLVPTDDIALGYIAKNDDLQLRQFIVIRPESIPTKAFDRSLKKIILKFEARAQQSALKSAHICSASRRLVVYKTKGIPELIDTIYPDLKNPDFTIVMGMMHARFATNTDTLIQNVQPLSIAMFNGEINNIRRFISDLKHNPDLQELLGTDLAMIDFNRYSDSAIMSYYMLMLELLGYDARQIHQAIFHTYSPKDDAKPAQFYNRMGVSGLEGPDANIRFFESGDDCVVYVEGDTMGWRPHVGVINSEWLSSGSELGIFPNATGEVLRLGPGDAWEILPNTGEVRLFTTTQDENKHYQQQMDAIQLLPPNVLPKNPNLHFSTQELNKRYQMAGITKELHLTFIQPMFNQGIGLTVSMGDDGPLEVITAEKPRLINVIKTDFAQITRPPLDYYREGEVMVADTFIGKKPPLKNMPNAVVSGWLVKNPIIDNQQMQLLKEDRTLNPIIIDITYPIATAGKGLQAALDRIGKACVVAAENHILIVLSDRAVDDNHASVPPILVIGHVDLLLTKMGIRHQVSLALESAVAATPLEQIAAISLGIDVINPYLIFIPNEKDLKNPEQFIRERNSYCQIALKEIYSAMARIGFRQLSGGYRGARQISAFGLDADIAAMMGIHSELDGFDWENIATTVMSSHLNAMDIGKYPKSNQERPKKWNPSTVRLWQSIASGKSSFETEYPKIKAAIEEANKHNLEGWFTKKPPHRFSAHYPMTVIIVGGGAAGFMQAQALLDSPMGEKIRIHIIEENVGNQFGKIHDGIAPDKPSTKRSQMQLLKQCLSDPRVRYYGGVTVGITGDVTFAELLGNYPLVIDARGAMMDNPLHLIEGSELATPASRIWKAYNGYFDPRNPNRYRPLRAHTRSDRVVVIGSGNVAADVIRLLLIGTSVDSHVHPSYQQFLQTRPVRRIDVFSRGTVVQSKMSLSELQSLAENNIAIYVQFNEPDTDFKKLDPETEEKILFFRRMKLKSNDWRNDQPQVHFHFECSPNRINVIGKNLLATEIIYPNGKKETFISGDVITAIGMKKPSSETDYVVGWASGQGGNLSLIEKSVAENTKAIVTADRNRQFDYRTNVTTEAVWQAKAAVTNTGILNIISWCLEGHPLDTVEEFRQAREFRIPIKEVEVSEPAGTTAKTTPTVKNQTANPNAVIIVDEECNPVLELPPDNRKLLSFLFSQPNKKPLVKAECDGGLVCGTCAVEEMSAPKQPIQRSNKEIIALKANGKNAKSDLLACGHSTNELIGGVYRIYKK